MPTLWLVDPEERRLVSRLESRGAIKEVEALIGLDRLPKRTANILKKETSTYQMDIKVLSLLAV